jgi:hypothetical protein
MHSLPAIVIMNMTAEQRKEYHRQEKIRHAERVKRESEAIEARWNFWIVAGLTAVAVFVAFII